MKQSNIKGWGIPIAAIGVMITVLIWSAPISQGIKNGVSICINNLIPSLFLFMVLSCFLMESGIGKRMLLFLTAPVAKLFHIPKSAATIFCFSLLGGFPIGAKLLADAVKRNEILPCTAERMLAYCVNCGPAFLISAVSIPVYHNNAIGIIVYISQVLAALIIGIFSGRKIKKYITAPEALNSTFSHAATYSSCFIYAVESTIRSMSLICALVLIFSGVNAVMNELGIITAFSQCLEGIMTKAEANSLLLGIIEVTTGCNELIGAPSLVVLIIITGFGGLCVQLQIRAIIGNMRMNFFYIYRPFYIFCSWFFSMILIRFFGGKSSVFGYQDKIIPKPFIISPIFTILLIILSILLLLSIKKSDTIQIQGKMKKDEI